MINGEEQAPWWRTGADKKGVGASRRRTATGRETERKREQETSGAGHDAFLSCLFLSRSSYTIPVQVLSLRRIITSGVIENYSGVRLNRTFGLSRQYIVTSEREHPVFYTQKHMKETVFPSG